MPKSKHKRLKQALLILSLLWVSSSYSRSDPDTTNTRLWIKPHVGLGLGKEYGVSPGFGLSFWYWHKPRSKDEYPRFHPFVTLEINPTPLWASFSGGLGYGSERIAIETVITRFVALDDTEYTTWNPKLRLGYKQLMLRFGPSFTLGTEKRLFGNFIQVGNVDLSVQLSWTPGAQ